MGLWLEYGWALLVIIGLEGLLSADNALVMGVLVKNLPEKKRKKALFYGIFGAYVFRFAALFAISFVVNIWQIQAIGAAYLIYLGVKNVIQNKKEDQEKSKSDSNSQSDSSQSLWKVIAKVEFTDIAFAIDSILAAVAIAVALPNTPLPSFGGMDGGKFLVVFIGMAVGLAFIRFAANYVVKYMRKYPVLEKAAFIIVAWVGVKLAIHTLAHPDVQWGLVPEGFTHHTWWKITFWGVMALIVIIAIIFSKKGANKEEEASSS
ncbi:TerC family protein [Halobacillus naozhouensis]|uniref:TerC family protein n=1 Tax=Halobacillus naozhouensis TaxID=554880 RepID=A0ABY8IX23_9BACI|nr:TerC family protein [Halobacillus naozhouensis]WFT74778.1 TerC family protein [Halobacillus naozhouensis]